MGALDGMEADFAKADPRGGGGGKPKIKVEHGNFVVEVLKIELNPSKRDNGLWYVVEFTIVKSDCPEIKVGREYGWSNDVKKRFGDSPIGLSNTVNFIAAAFGLDMDDPDDAAKAEEIDAGDVEKSAGDLQPLTGKLVRLVVDQKTADKSGRDYWRHTWAVADEE